MIALKICRVASAPTLTAPPVAAVPPVRVTPAMIELEPAGTSTTRLLFRASITVVRAPAPWPPTSPGPKMSTLFWRTSGPSVSR